MATLYPNAVDDGTSIPNPTGTNTQNNPDHASLHSNTGDAVKALEAKLGTGASTPVVSRLLFGTGTGTSAWTQLTSAQLAASLSDETGTGSSVFATTPTLITPKVDTINESTPTNGVTIDSLNIKDATLNTNNSVVTSNITDANITNPKLQNSGSFNSSWAWATWTPTFVNLSGGTLNYAKYMRWGKTIQYRLKYTLAGAGVAGAVTFTTPSTMHADYSTTPAEVLGLAALGDTGTAQYMGWALWASSTTLAIRAESSATNGQAVSLSSTVPHTWANTDVVQVVGVYEEA